MHSESGRPDRILCPACEAPVSDSDRFCPASKAFIPQGSGADDQRETHPADDDRTIAERGRLSPVANSATRSIARVGRRRGMPVTLIPAETTTGMSPRMEATGMAVWGIGHNRRDGVCTNRLGLRGSVSFAVASDTWETHALRASFRGVGITTARGVLCMLSCRVYT